MKAHKLFLPLSLLLFMGCSGGPANEQAAEAAPQEQVVEAAEDQLPKGSPAATAQYDKDGLLIQVDYSAPYKRGREIFGGLVPFDEVWRTGANNATTFETNQDLVVDGRVLPAGPYTLWTIPHEGSWEVIFNTKQYSWGSNETGAASREAEADALVVTVPVETLPAVVEQFAINVEDAGVPTLVLSWDLTKVAVPRK